MSGTVGEYTTSGATVSASLISGFNGPQGMLVDGNDLFINTDPGHIGEYTTSGATVNATLISGLSSPTAMTVEGNDLFVANYGNGTIGEYTTSGATVNASLVSGLINPDGLVIETPEPSTLALIGTGTAALFLFRHRVK